MNADVTLGSPSQSSETNPTSAETEASVWENFILSKGSPQSFLRDLAKRVIIHPDASVKSKFAELVQLKPSNSVRFLHLLHATSSAEPGLQKIISGLAADVFRLWKFDLDTNTNEPQFFREYLQKWIALNRPRPVRQEFLVKLFCLLRYGALNNFVDYDFANALISEITEKKQKAKNTAQSKSSIDPRLDGLLRQPAKPILNALMQHSEAWAAEMTSLRLTVIEQKQKISHLAEQNVCAETKITELKNQIHELGQKDKQAQEEVEKLRKQAIELQDGFQHKLDTLRSRMRGVFNGELSRWLQTALDATQANPPFTGAIRERLEESLNLIQKESQWLQPSA